MNGRKEISGYHPDHIYMPFKLIKYRLEFYIFHELDSGFVSQHQIS
jgi:hypothetical protein